MIVQATLLMNFLPNKAQKAKLPAEEIKERDEAITKEFKDRIAVLTIAYHNLGVEQEFMKMVSILMG